MTTWSANENRARKGWRPNRLFGTILALALFGNAIVVAALKILTENYISPYTNAYQVDAIDKNLKVQANLVTGSSVVASLFIYLEALDKLGSTDDAIARLKQFNPTRDDLRTLEYDWSVVHPAIMLHALAGCPQLIPLRKNMRPRWWMLFDRLIDRDVTCLNWSLLP